MATGAADVTASDLPFDVIVVGAGVTGSEAGWRLAQRGVRTLLLTTSLDTIATVPRDGWRFEPPSGGLLERVAPEASRAGRWSARALRRAAKRELERLSTLHVLQSTVVEVLLDPDRTVTGVETWEGVEHRGRCVALCVGSFLHARLRVGESEQRAGRLSELSDDGLYEQLGALGLVFQEHHIALEGDEDRPGYEVRYAALSDASVGADGAVTALPGLYAFGLCAGGAPDVGASARAGAAAARTLAAALTSG